MAAMFARTAPFARFAVVAAILAGTALSLGGCASDSSGDESVAGDENEVKVDTRTPAARRQYDANVAFAMSYKV